MESCNFGRVKSILARRMSAIAFWRRLKWWNHSWFVNGVMPRYKNYLMEHLNWKLCIGVWIEVSQQRLNSVFNPTNYLHWWARKWMKRICIGEYYAWSRMVDGRCKYRTSNSQTAALTSQSNGQGAKWITEHLFSWCESTWIRLFLTIHFQEKIINPSHDFCSRVLQLFMGWSEEILIITHWYLSWWFAMILDADCKLDFRATPKAFNLYFAIIITNSGGTIYMLTNPILHKFRYLLNWHWFVLRNTGTIVFTLNTL